MARTISQITTAVGMPNTITMIKGIAESICCLSYAPAGLMQGILLPRANWLQAAKKQRPKVRTPPTGIIKRPHANATAPSSMASIG